MILPFLGLVQEELFSLPVEVVARPDHPLCRDLQVTLKILQQYPWVVPGKGTPTRTIFESTFTEAGLDVPTRLIETSSQILIRALLIGSDRLTMVSEHQIQHELSMVFLKRFLMRFLTRIVANGVHNLPPCRFWR